ncbi:MAG: hypothetical protein LBP23_04410, partial [Treponema sp.]|nr:hypothetical protein [Treponema sp.]
FDLMKQSHRFLKHNPPLKDRPYTCALILDLRAVTVNAPGTSLLYFRQKTLFPDPLKAVFQKYDPAGLPYFETETVSSKIL